LIRNVDVDKELEFELKEDALDEETKTFAIDDIPGVTMPLGYRRVYENAYLQDRGFIEEDFKRYEVGIAKLHPKLKRDYIIFPVYIKGIIKGYVSRSTHSKEYCEENNIARWLNSDTDFSLLLYGYDDIKGTQVVLTEGVFAKRAVDQAGYCGVATFGKKVSVEQIFLLLLKGVEDIIFFYDFDAVRAIKNFGFDLRPYFKSVKAAEINQRDKDPDDLTISERKFALENADDIFSYSLNKVQMGQLRS
jgi:hypothetical protein